MGWAGTGLMFPLLFLPLYVRDTSAAGCLVAHGLLALFMLGVVLREARASSAERGSRRG